MTYGHQAGDEALRRVGESLREYGRRPLDLSARYGGEEFALIMHDVTVEHARELAEHLKGEIAALGIPHCASSAAATVTLSIGVAVVEPALGRSSAGLVQLADEALYAAKAQGRDRIVVKGPDAHGVLDTGVLSFPGERSRDGTTG